MTVFTFPMMIWGLPASHACQLFETTRSDVLHIHFGMRFIDSRLPRTSWNSVNVYPGQLAVTWTPLSRHSSHALHDAETMNFLAAL